MEFNPGNPIIRLCVMGMSEQDKGNTDAAYTLFLQAWQDAGHDFEKYIAAYYLARHQKTVSDKVKWFETALEFALKVDNDSVKGALLALYNHIADGYTELGDKEHAERYRTYALQSSVKPADKGPFYHGTRADLPIGGLLTPGGSSNYKTDFRMNHIYFTASVNGAGLAAALAKGDEPERVYIIEPTGSFENDPNVTDKKFPGNPSRSYRSLAPLRIVGEINDWNRTTPEELQKWRDKLADNKGDIIN